MAGPSPTSRIYGLSATSSNIENNGHLWSMNFLIPESARGGRCRRCSILKRDVVLDKLEVSGEIIGNTWADFWDWEVVVSERVVRAVEERSPGLIKTIPVHFGSDVILDPRLRKVPPPNYYLIEPKARYRLDFGATGVDLGPICRLCRRGKGVPSTPLNLTFKLPSEPAMLFWVDQIRWTRIFCTHEFLLMAARHGWTGGKFTPIDTLSNPDSYIRYWKLPEAKGAPRPIGLAKPRTEAWGRARLADWQKLAKQVLKEAGKAWGEELSFDAKTVFVLDRLAGRDPETLSEKLRSYLRDKRALTAILSEVFITDLGRWPSDEEVAEHGVDMPWTMIDDARNDGIADEVEKWLEGRGGDLSDIFLGGGEMEEDYFPEE